LSATATARARVNRSPRLQVALAAAVAFIVTFLLGATIFDGGDESSTPATATPVVVATPTALPPEPRPIVLTRASAPAAAARPAKKKKPATPAAPAATPAAPVVSSPPVATPTPSPAPAPTPAPAPAPSPKPFYDSK
jgi:hypothetical protein